MTVPPPPPPSPPVATTGGEKSEPSDKGGVHLDIKEVVLLIIAQSVGLAGLVVDDTLLVFVLLFVSWVAFVTIFILHKTNLFYKVIYLSVITSVYAMVALGFKSLNLEKQEAAVFSNIEIEALTPYLTSYPYLLPFVVKNKSGVDIDKYRTSCSYHKIQGEHGGGLVAPNLVYPNWTERPMKAGQENTFKCPTEFFKIDDALSCVDVTMKFQYKLAIDPNKEITKVQRYVANKNLGNHWFPQMSDVSGNYCDGSLKIN